MNSVVRVAAAAAILKIQSREKLEGCVILSYFYNLPRPPKVYIDKYKLK